MEWQARTDRQTAKGEIQQRVAALYWVCLSDKDIARELPAQKRIRRLAEQHHITLSETSVNNWLRHPAVSLWRTLAEYLVTEEPGRRLLFGELVSLFALQDAGATSASELVEVVFSRLRSQIDAMKTKMRQIAEALEEISA